MKGTATELDPKVLIVDDQSDMRLIVRTLLEAPGWSFTEAASGEEALERCAERAFDVVVLDYMMPGLDGLEVARRLRRSGFAGPIVLYSAYLSEPIEREAGELGLPTFDKADPLRLADRVRELVG